MCRFYLSQAGPTHRKHGGGKLPSASSNENIAFLPPLHPFLAFATHYALALTSIFAVHDIFFYHTSNQNNINIAQRQDKIASFALVYVIILFGARYTTSFAAGRIRQHAVLYELTWMCNSTLLMGFLCFGGLGNMFVDANILQDYKLLGWFCRKRPLVVTACCVGVSIDQVLWYVDLTGRILMGKFPIGVMKYLTWKQTLWIDRLTCTHHLWTIPLFVYGAGELNMHSYTLSGFVVAIHVLLSRWLTPHHIKIVSNTLSQHQVQSDPTKYRYLNVNLSHELWKDISFSFLQISYDGPPAWLYLFRLLLRWQALNFLVFIGILLPLSRVFQ